MDLLTKLAIQIVKLGFSFIKIMVFSFSSMNKLEDFRLK